MFANKSTWEKKKNTIQLAVAVFVYLKKRENDEGIHIMSRVLSLIRKPYLSTGLDSAVVMSSTNGLVDTGFASRYRLQPRACFLKDPMGRCMATTPFSLSLTSNKVTTNY